MWQWIKERVWPAMRPHAWSLQGQSAQAALHPCVAHRGFSGRAPENTLAAFRMAMDIPEVERIELDVHLSRDEVPVVIHDSTLKRTTNGQGRVRDYTARQLALLDAGSWFNRAFAAERVPTLEQVLELTAGRCRLNVELKGELADRKLLAAKAVETIMASSAHRESTVVTSFQPDVLQAVRERSATLRTGLIVEESSLELLRRLEALEASFLSISYPYLTPRLLKESASAGIEVMAWTVNMPADLRRLASRSEPFQLCTNFPDRWLAAVNAARR